MIEKDFSPELLEKTGALLQKNPEYYTTWNVRRRIYSNEFEIILQAAEKAEITDENKTSQILDIIHLDLGFLFPLLLKFPKCYWIWNHRIWLLEQSSLLLPWEKARKIWEDELGLVGKMLARDNRNYHGWGYRRFIIRNLETENLKGASMSRSEYAYTTKMIGSNLSNFSAWHNRTNLIIKILAEEHASSTERRKMLDEGKQVFIYLYDTANSKEIELIHKALFDPYDQSLWFYHQTLMSNFDPGRCHNSMAPDLIVEDKLLYLQKEREFITELLEDVDDCKWAYQALVECAIVEGKLRGEMSPNTKNAVQKWLQELKRLDPLRNGRWLEMEESIQKGTACSSTN